MNIPNPVYRWPQAVRNSCGVEYDANSLATDQYAHNF